MVWKPVQKSVIKNSVPAKKEPNNSNWQEGGKGKWADGGKGGWPDWGKGGWADMMMGKGMWQGKGSWKQATTPKVPDNFEIDKEARYAGTVESYHKWSGYGFITLDKPGIVPKDKIYVHWSNIQSEDRYPFLQKGMAVEFGLMKWKDKMGGGETKLRAKTVTCPGGEMVALQDEHDAEKKTFIGGQHLRYTGNLKFYDPNRAFGYVTLDDGFALDEPVSKELRVEEQEVNCCGKRPQKYLEKMPVEFGIWKNFKGAYMVYNMTLPGGIPITQENLENRKALPGAFKGTIHNWNWQQGWGLIAPDPAARLPPSVQAKLSAASTEAQSQGKTPMLYFRKPDLARGTSSWIRKGQGCSFQVYTDDKGAGACEVSVDAA